MTDQQHLDRSAETLRLALEVAQLGFWDQDFHRNIVQRSPEWARMLGYEPGEIDDQLDVWRDLIHPDDLPAVREITERHESGETPVFAVEHRMRTKDGRWKWILNWGRIVERDADGEPLRALGFHLDISARKRAEAELARADKLASLGTLAGGIAHDFNNVLTAVLGNLSLSLYDRNLGPDTREALEKAERGAHRARELAGRLAGFTRGADSPRGPVRLDEVLDEAASLALGGSRTAMDLRCAGEDLAVEGDEGQLVQLVSNLLLNADQAMSGGGRIGVDCHRLEIPAGDPRPLVPGTYVEIVIHDEGAGIREEDLDKIFDPFFTTKETGRGLGLATVDSIARAHRGHVSAESEGRDRGSTFLVVLPATNAPRADERRGPEKLNGGRGRVLVVDDEEMVREFAERVLAKLGYEPVLTATAAAGIEAFARARGGGAPFVAVILDLTLPGDEDGVQILQRLREIDPAVQAIVSSGYSTDPVMVEYRKYGFVACLPKPYSAQDVGEVLAGLRDHRGEAEG